MDFNLTSAVRALNERAAKQGAEAHSYRQRKLDALTQVKQGPTSPGCIPSGPRKRGEGCDDEDQGIISAEMTPSGGARLCITLLAAGFIIGPAGASVRAVSQRTGADIRSWSDTCEAHGRQRRVRTLVMEGSCPNVTAALAILTDAVERYKELCEGRYAGQAVTRCQPIGGVDFYYSPPPRSAVPHAASLRGDRGNHDQTPMHSPPPAGPRLHTSASASPAAAEGKENAPWRATRAALSANGTCLEIPSLTLDLGVLMAAAAGGTPAGSTDPAALLPADLGLTSAFQVPAPVPAWQSVLAVEPPSAGGAAPMQQESMTGKWEHSSLHGAQGAPTPRPNHAAQQWHMPQLGAGILEPPFPSMGGGNGLLLQQQQQQQQPAEYSLFGHSPSLLNSGFLGNLAAAGPIASSPSPPSPTGWPATVALDSHLQVCGFPTYSGFAEQSAFFRHPNLFSPGPVMPVPSAAVPMMPFGASAARIPAGGPTSMVSAFEPWRNSYCQQRLL